MSRYRTLLPACLIALSSLCAATSLPAQETADPLKPYDGPSEKGVDTSTMTGKVMCGYQGWFNVEGDGAQRGWVHWTKGRGGLGPGNAKIDLWPDMSELGPDERFATGFKLADGKPAEVFSSHKKATVLRHFEWMKTYGIDGVFVQRFSVDLRDARARRHNNTVLRHCREGANRNGRAYVVMYDLSGMGRGSLGEVIADWKVLREKMKITEDKAYLRHREKPLVAVWGIGFNDNRRYTLADCRKLVEEMKAEGCSIMIGVPTYWREQTRDTLPDKELHEIIKLADIVSPWAVGRFGDASGVARHQKQDLEPDIKWCQEAKVDYLPVVFPGFSWANMNARAKLDQIPRRKGEFLWSQMIAAKRAGSGMLYVAMFDEVDEGTAIFKCTNEPPVDATNKFITYEGLPSDFYLKLTGSGGKMLRGEIPVTDKLPEMEATK